MAIPIVAFAFAIGYFGLSELVGDDTGVITADEGAAVELGISQAELGDRIGEPSLQVETGTEGDECLYYEIADSSDRAWQFCFARDDLVKSGEVRLPEDG
jgi:hypothetical protein